MNFEIGPSWKEVSREEFLAATDIPYYRREGYGDCIVYRDRQGQAFAVIVDQTRPEKYYLESDNVPTSIS